MTEAGRLVARLVRCDTVYEEHMGRKPRTTSKLTLCVVSNLFRARLHGSDYNNVVSGRGPTPDDAIGNLLLAIRSLPSESSRRRGHFRESVVKLIERGRQMGIDEGYISPLIRLAEDLKGDGQ